MHLVEYTSGYECSDQHNDEPATSCIQRAIVSSLFTTFVFRVNRERFLDQSRDEYNQPSTQAEIRLTKFARSRYHGGTSCLQTRRVAGEDGGEASGFWDQS
jgi:hypothetical protein